MNWTIIIIETVVMTIAFTAMILIPLVKNPVWWIHDYPKDIRRTRILPWYSTAETHDSLMMTYLRQ